MIGVSYVIEGPSLPLVAAGAMPSEALIIFTLTKLDCGLRLTAAWDHALDDSWVVGSWPDYDGYLGYMAARRNASD